MLWIGLPLTTREGFGYFKIYDSFCYSTPVLFITAANIWIFIKQSNLESLMAQICNACNEVVPSSMLIESKTQSLYIVCGFCFVSVVDLLVNKLPGFRSNQNILGFIAFPLILAPSFFVYLANVGKSI